MCSLRRLVTRVLRWEAPRPEGGWQALSGKHARLTIVGGGEYIDAVRKVVNMLRRDSVPPGVDKDTVPLFRVAGTLEPLRSPFMRAETKRLMELIGEEPFEFNTHSFRIGGATALFAAGADMTAIKTLGRWSSDIYQLYVRACRERCIEWTRKAGSQRFTDVDFTVDEVADYQSANTPRGDGASRAAAGTGGQVGVVESLRLFAWGGEH